MTTPTLQNENPVREWSPTATQLGPFATGFTCLVPEDVIVEWRVPTGQPQPLALSTDYTVSGGSPETDGYNVTLLRVPGGNASWPEGAQLVVSRQSDRSQPYALTPTLPIRQSTLKTRLDSLTRQSQEHGAKIAQAVVTPYGEDAVTLLGAEQRAGTIQTYGDDGEPTNDRTLSAFDADVQATRDHANAAGASADAAAGYASSAAENAEASQILYNQIDPAVSEGLAQIVTNYESAVTDFTNAKNSGIAAIGGARSDALGDIEDARSGALSDVGDSTVVAQNAAEAAAGYAASIDPGGSEGVAQLVGGVLKASQRPSTDGITEGAENLWFTNARARTAAQSDTLMPSGAFAIAESIDVAGAHVTVADVTARNAIAAYLRRNGMVVTVAGGTDYVYNGADDTADNAQWADKLAAAPVSTAQATALSAKAGTDLSNVPSGTIVSRGTVGTLATARMTSGGYPALGIQYGQATAGIASTFNVVIDNAQPVYSGSATYPVGTSFLAYNEQPGGTVFANYMEAHLLNRGTVIASERDAYNETNRTAVVAATIGNIGLSGSDNIDGIVVTTGQRVLVKDQNTPSQNGIYIVNGGAWTRATDSNTWTSLIDATVSVSSGSTNGGKSFAGSATSGGTLGTTAVSWAVFDCTPSPIPTNGFGNSLRYLVGDQIGASGDPGLNCTTAVSICSNGDKSAKWYNGIVGKRDALINTFLFLDASATQGSKYGVWLETPGRSTDHLLTLKSRGTATAGRPLLEIRQASGTEVYPDDSGSNVFTGGVLGRWDQTGSISIGGSACLGDSYLAPLTVSGNYTLTFGSLSYANVTSFFGVETRGTSISHGVVLGADGGTVPYVGAGGVSGVKSPLMFRAATTGAVYEGMRLSGDRQAVVFSANLELPSSTVGTLPTLGNADGALRYATNCRGILGGATIPNSGTAHTVDLLQTPGNGVGAVVQWNASASKWFVLGTDIQAAA